MPQTTPHAHISGPTTGIVISPEQLRTLPVEGDAWDDVVEAADNSIEHAPVASNQDDDKDVYAFAKALCVTRSPDDPAFAGYIGELLAEIAWGITPASGTYNWLAGGANTLGLSRNITSFVLAADLIGLGNLDPTLNGAFRAFLAGPLRTTVMSNRTLISTHNDRPNNWGTHAGAARLAVAAYIGDDADWAQAVRVFRGWLGDRSQYASFEWGSLSWHYDEGEPVGINPVGATKFATDDVYDIDGVLPDDQRRNGDLQWPPPRTAYVYEALQGAVLQAIIIHHCSRGSMGPTANPFSWSDKALLRAYKWLDDPDRGNFIVNVDYSAQPDPEHWNDGPETDDYWQIAAVKKRHGSDASTLPAITSGHGIGKAFGFAHWFKEASTWLAD